ncbi:MAG: type II toxin-antitoxin system RelB/DinJ family antitoxin [Coprobacillus sp.]|nr:type II toxin-antitoxin system RelB/DinJ family antitoxin [Coprobacillus sp.]
MANTNVTVRIDETLKAQLQELMSNLGLDMTTFFTMAAKQAVREQALPFKPDMNVGIYNNKAYKMAMENTKYNTEGKAVISSDDEWIEETEWDDMFEQMKKERGIS